MDSGASLEYCDGREDQGDEGGILRNNFSLLIQHGESGWVKGGGKDLCSGDGVCLVGGGAVNWS